MYFVQDMKVFKMRLFFILFQTIDENVSIDVYINGHLAIMNRN